VCLGSSRSNPCAELMLARMFGVPAFATAPAEARDALEFGFVWNPRLSNRFPSYFHLAPEDIEADDAAAAKKIRSQKASALWSAKKVYLDEVTPQRWGETFGLCLAQRRRGRQVWLLLLGITGAATYLAAKVANRMVTRLHESADDSRPSPVYWGIVRAKVAKAQAGEFFNLRQFDEEESHSQPPLPAVGTD
jgi:hypothetical protein